MKKTSLWIYLLIFTCLIGMGISYYLTAKKWETLRLESGLSSKGGASHMICDINQTFSCSDVIGSDYGDIAQIPISGISLVYFAYLLFPAILALIAHDLLKKLLTVPFFVSLASLPAVIYFNIISSLVIKHYCLFCLALHLLMVLAFLFLKQALNIPFRQIGAVMKKNIKDKTLGLLGHSIYGVIIFAVGFFLLHHENVKSQGALVDFDSQAYLRYQNSKPVFPIDIQNRPVWGNPQAKVKIVEFSDFQCPFCKKAAFEFKPLLKEFENEVAFYFINYPLDKSCNPDMQHDLHKNACNAAKAAICAQDQEKFWEYHDVLFANQTKLEKEDLASYAQKVKLDMNQWEACLASELPAARVASDLEVGRKAKVIGTPTLFLNGRLFEDGFKPYTRHLLKTLIEAENK